MNNKEILTEIEKAIELAPMELKAPEVPADKEYTQAWDLFDRVLDEQDLEDNPELESQVKALFAKHKVTLESTGLFHRGKVRESFGYLLRRIREERTEQTLDQGCVTFTDGECTYRILNYKDALRDFALMVERGSIYRNKTPSKASIKTQGLAFHSRPKSGDKAKWEAILMPASFSPKNVAPKWNFNKVFHGENMSVATDSRRMHVAIKTGCSKKDCKEIKGSFVAIIGRTNKAGLPVKVENNKCFTVSVEQLWRETKDIAALTKDYDYTKYAQLLLVGGEVRMYLNYPNIGEYGKKVGVVLVAVNPEFMREACEFMAHTGNETMEIRTYGVDDPIQVIGAQEFAIIMPARIY